MPGQHGAVQMERTTDVMQRAAYAGLAAADESVEGAAAVGPKKPGKHPALGKFKGAARKLQVGHAMDKAHKVQVEQMCCGCQPIEPKSLLRAGWDAWIMCTIAWVVTVIPVRLCLLGLHAEQDAVVEAILDIAWLIDLPIRLRTAYEDPDTGFVERRKSKIALYYAKRGMIMDLVAVVPCIYQVVVPASARESSSGEGDGIVTIMWMGGSRICKMFRVFDKVFRESVIEFINGSLEHVLQRCCKWKYKHSDAHHTINQFIYGFQYAFIFFTILHVAGCIFYAIGTHDQVMPGGDLVEGWVAREEWDEEVGWSPRWLTSFYWAITTVATVGYGDITAHTTWEKSWAPLVMAMGTLINAWLIATFSQAMDRGSQQQKLHDDSVSRIREYMKSKRVPPELSKKVLAYDDALFLQEREFDVHKWIVKMPPALAYEMLDFLYIQRLIKVECFAELPEQILVSMSQLIVPYPMQQGQVLFDAGDVARETFIIARGVDGEKGQVKIEPYKCLNPYADGQPRPKHCGASDAGQKDGIWIVDETKKAIVLEDGGFFGVNALDFKPDDVIRTLKATALTDGELMLLSADAVEAVAKEYPEIKPLVLKYIAQRREELGTTGDAAPATPRADSAADDSAGGSGDGGDDAVLSSKKVAARLIQLEDGQTEMKAMLKQQSEQLKTLIELSTHV